MVAVLLHQHHHHAVEYRQLYPHAAEISPPLEVMA